MTRTRTAVLDVLGTLFDLEPVRSSFVELGAPAPALEAWFQRILHEAATVTLIESYRPFRELASSALRTTLAQLGMDASRKEPLEALAELEPYPDASEALARLRSAGVSVVALTNGSRESTMRLLQRGGLAGHVEKVFSC